jgi:hypothetical protein
MEAGRDIAAVRHCIDVIWLGSETTAFRVDPVSAVARIRRDRKSGRCFRLRPALGQTVAGELGDGLTRSLSFAPAPPETTGDDCSPATAMKASQTGAS